MTMSDEQYKAERERLAKLTVMPGNVEKTELDELKRRVFSERDRRRLLSPAVPETAYASPMAAMSREFKRKKN